MLEYLNDKDIFYSNDKIDNWDISTEVQLSTELLLWTRDRKVKSSSILKQSFKFSEV